MDSPTPPARPGSVPGAAPASLEQRWGLPPRPAAGAPLFVLAAGWRSGSTLLQRMLCASGEVLLWGEPYGRAGTLPALAAAARVPGPDWPRSGHFADEAVYEHLGEHWIANLYPPLGALRDAHGRFLDTWLAAPARARGFARFGLKEVRLDALVARYLEWLYPDARFVFLTRNPWDCWASARGARWWERWPDRPVETLQAFAAHWRRLAESFLDWPEENGCLVRYEDLIHPEAELGALQAHCRLARLDAEARGRVLRGISKPPHDLPPEEVEALGAIVGEVAEALGYRPRTAPVARAFGGGGGVANPQTLG